MDFQNGRRVFHWSHIIKFCVFSWLDAILQCSIINGPFILFCFFLRVFGRKNAGFCDSCHWYETYACLLKIWSACRYSNESYSILTTYTAYGERETLLQLSLQRKVRHRPEEYYTITCINALKTVTQKSIYLQVRPFQHLLIDRIHWLL